MLCLLAVVLVGSQIIRWFNATAIMEVMSGNGAMWGVTLVNVCGQSYIHYHSLLYTNCLLGERKTNQSCLKQCKLCVWGQGCGGRSVSDVLIYNKYRVRQGKKIKKMRYPNTGQNRCKLIDQSRFKGHCGHTVRKYSAGRILKVTEREGFNVSELSKLKLKMILSSTDWDCNRAAELDQRAWDMRTFACHTNRAFSVLRRPSGYGTSPICLFS